jgi:predicted signal transduction protein with EAL and GGDEF domain
MMQHCFEKQVGALIQTSDFSRWLTSARSRRGKVTYRAFEADLCDGRWIWVTETMQADGSMLCIASDITELKTSQRSLRLSRDVALRASLTDPLTGISNRMHIFEQLAQRIEQVTKITQQIGVVLIDLDEFKKISFVSRICGRVAAQEACQARDTGRVP